MTKFLGSIAVLSILAISSFAANAQLNANSEQRNHNHTLTQNLTTKILAKTTYTCEMHPEIEKTSPGKCPKCHMNLVPVE